MDPTTNRLLAAASGAADPGNKLSVSPAVNGKTIWDLDTDGDLELSSAGTYTIAPVGSSLQAAVKMWGAGGGEGWNENGYVPRQGGGGGYTSGIISLTGSYQAIVGAGGRGGPSANTTTAFSTSVLGGASGGRRVSDRLWGGSGGGASGLFSSSATFANAVMIAGGGGGGCGSYGGTGRGGGAGGGTSGLAGSYPYAIIVDGESGSITDKTGQVTVSGFGTISSSTQQARFGSRSVFVGSGNSGATISQASSVLNIGTDDFTISCWVLIPSGTQFVYQRAWWFETNSSGKGSGLAPERGSSSNSAITLNTPFGQIFATNPQALDSWVHIGVTRRAGTTYFFLGGTLQGTVTGSYSVTLGTAPVLGNGYFSNTLVGGWNGYIDDFYVIKGCALYTSSFTVAGQPAVSIDSKSGGGGTQSAGGAAGSPAEANDAVPLAGTQLNGGTGGSSSGSPYGTGGGGGGGGYFGGGGGGIFTTSDGLPGGGGGGGSGYFHPSLVTSGSTLTGAGNTPGGANKSGRGTAGFGGQGGTGSPADAGDAGEPGKIIFSSNLANL